MNSLGESAVSPANPLKKTQTIASNGVCDKGSATQMSGFTIINADTMDDAMSIAQGCPFLKTGGTSEFGELMVMSG
jgi:hypothetical protein